MQFELAHASAENIHALLCAAMNLFFTATKKEEKAHLMRGWDAVLGQVLVLTGEHPFGMPPTTDFKLDTTYDTLDHDYGLKAAIASAFLSFARAAKSIPELQPAIANLIKFHNNMPGLLDRVKYPRLDMTLLYSGLALRPHISREMWAHVGSAKPPLLILMAFYNVTCLSIDVLRPEWVAGEHDGVNLEFAYAVQRIYQRLVEDKEFDWLPHLSLPHYLANMYANSGFMKPPPDKVVEDQAGMKKEEEGSTESSRMVSEEV